MIRAMDIYAYEIRLARRLLAWGGVSVAAGVALALGGHAAGSAPVRAFGGQTVGWGAIDAALAVGGLARARRLRATPPDDQPEAAAEAERVRRLLAVNAGLDILYVAGGLAVAAGRGRTDIAARGHGLAAVAQGAFLFAFDVWHAARVPRAATPEPPVGPAADGAPGAVA
jgi:hypothetical protein